MLARLKNLPRERQLLLAFCVIFLVFFRARSALVVWGAFDDVCYLQWLYQFIGLDPKQCYSTYHFPGAAIFWLPAGWLGQAFAYLTHQSVDDWIPALIGVTSVGCFGVSLAVADKLIRRSGLRTVASLKWPVLFMFNMPLLYYTLMRSTMAHGVELLLVSLTFYFLIEKKYLGVLLAASFVVVTRLNDAPIWLMVVGFFLDQRKISTTFASQKLLRFLILLFAGLWAIPLLTMAFSTGYGADSADSGSFLIPILKDVSWKQLIRTTVGDRFGLCFTASWWLFCLGAGLIFFRKLGWMSRGAVAWLAFLFVLSIGWTSAGGDLGYRYLTGSHFAALVLWLELIPLLSSRAVNLSKAALVAGSAWGTYIDWMHPTRFMTFWRAMEDGTVGSFFRAVIEPFALLGVSPAGMVIYSWNPKIASFFPGVSGPNYRLNSPALWVLTALTVTAILIIGFSLRPRLTQKEITP